MGQRLRFWVIADDLTGALDTAAPFATHGSRTAVVPWPGPRRLGAALAAAAAGQEVVVVDTASRHIAGREAARRVRSVVTAASGIDRRAASARTAARGFFKKIDSTLRGNVRAELAAFRAATGVRCLPVAPAFPAQGRTTRDGAVWVHGRPLAESPAAHDALDPTASGEVARLAPPGALEIFDAATDADLRRVATRLARTGRLGAVVGSGGLAAAIAATSGSTARPATARAAGGGVLVVSGSAHPVAQAQARALVGGGALGLVAPIDAATPDRDRRATVALASSALASGRCVVLVCPPLAAGTRVTPRRAATVAARLATLARAVVTAGPVSAVFTVGGDTTAALASAMRWTLLAVDGTLVPGVAIVRLLATPGRRRGRAGPTFLMTKSGAFGDPQTLRRLVRRLTPLGTGSTPR